MECTVWEHPEYGAAYVYWTWKGGRWVVVGIEFDFFTPSDVQDELTRDLEMDGVLWGPTPPHGIPDLAQRRVVP